MAKQPAFILLKSSVENVLYQINLNGALLSHKYLCNIGRICD